MADIPVVTPTVDAAKSAVSFAKNRTFAFIILTLVVLVVGIKYSRKIVDLIAKIPVVGMPVARFIAAGLALLATVAIAGDAHAATGAAAAASDAGWILALLGTAGVGLGALLMSREVSEDLVTSTGGKSLTGVASTTQTLTYKPQVVSIEGLWKKVTGFGVERRIQIDQPSSGGSVINADELARSIDGIKISNGLFGTLLSKDVARGPILKHLIEFVGNGYRASAGARAQIASSDGDTAVYVYAKVPLAPQWAIRAQQDFAIWAGWMGDTAVDCSEPAWAAGTSPLESVSTGIALEATAEWRAAAFTVLDKVGHVPVLSCWRRFEQAAASGSRRFEAKQWLATDGLSLGTRQFARVAGVYQLADILGLGGADGVDNITSFQCTDLGINRTENMGLAVLPILDLMSPRGPKGGVGTSTPLHDLAGAPYRMSSTPNASLAMADLHYLPLLTPTREQEIARLPLYHKGTPADLAVEYEYTTTPTSGTHVMVVNTVQKLALEVEQRLAGMAGRALGSTPLADGETVAQLRNRNYDPAELAILPTELVAAG